MSIATEILNLRRDQTSSVSALLAAIEWQRVALNEAHILARGYAVMQAADSVLLNVTVHAVEMLDQPRIRETRRAVVPSRRRRDLGRFSQHQRALFA